MSHDATPPAAAPDHSALHGATGAVAPGHEAHGHGGGHEPAHHPHVNYLAIFLALCACTALSVVFDIVDLNKRTVAVLVLAVAVAKAQYVMRYFMHLKFEGLWKYVLLLPTAILACGLPLALAPDIALHYYTPQYVVDSEVPEGYVPPAQHDSAPATNEEQADPQPQSH